MERRGMVVATLLLLTVSMVLPAPAAAADGNVQIRLNSYIKYPSDRDITVSVTAQAFETVGADNVKPLREPVDVLIEVRNSSSRQLIASRDITIQANEETIVRLGRMNVSQVPYEVTAIGTQGEKTSIKVAQLFNVYSPPQRYTAIWLSGKQFRIIPLDESVNLTITEYVDHGLLHRDVSRSFQLDGNHTMKIEVPQGYRRVIYHVEDEYGWANYERVDDGQAFDGPAYEWEFGDIRRVEPYSTFVSPWTWGMMSIGVAQVVLLLGLVVRNMVTASSRTGNRRGRAQRPAWRRRRHDKEAD